MINSKTTYSTKQIADMFHIHPNTVRLYENINFITKPERLSNGYRVFTELHIEQIRLIKDALKDEVCHNGLRKMAVQIIKEAAACDFFKALIDTQSYLKMLEREIDNAYEAIEIVAQIMNHSDAAMDNLIFTRKQAAAHLGTTVDTIRNWELNGLITIKRSENGYRVYNQEDIRRLKIIRSLRYANYSLTAILRLLKDLTEDKTVDIEHSIDTPKASEENVAACDRLLTTLLNMKKNAEDMQYILQRVISIGY